MLSLANSNKGFINSVSGRSLRDLVEICIKLSAIILHSEQYYIFQEYLMHFQNPFHLVQALLEF